VFMKDCCTGLWYVQFSRAVPFQRSARSVTTLNILTQLSEGFRLIKTTFIVLVTCNFETACRNWYISIRDWSRCEMKLIYLHYVNLGYFLSVISEPFYFGMWGSSVSIVTRLGDGQPTNHGSIPGRDKDLPLVHSVPSAPGVHPFRGGGDPSSGYGRGCEVGPWVDSACNINKVKVKQSHYSP
jgi:hypothetical protein